VYDSLLNFLVRENHGLDRPKYPLSVGLPIREGDHLEPPNSIRGDDGRTYRCQCRTLSKWPSGHPRWVLLNACIDIKAHETRIFTAGRDEDAADNLTASSEEFSLAACGSNQFFQILPDTGLRPFTGTISVTDVQGNRTSAQVKECQTLEEGPICQHRELSGSFGKTPSLRLETCTTWFHASATLKLEVTIHNARRAKHPGGYWDLGDANSEHLKCVTLGIQTNLPNPRSIAWKESLETPWERSTESHWSIQQANSGGEHWNSRVHVNHRNEVPTNQRGYVLRDGMTENTGRRATPSLILQSGSVSLFTTMTDFWQKCPSGIEVKDDEVRIHLLSPPSGQTAELQPGEKFTRTIWLQTANTSLRRENHDAAVFNIHQPLTVLPTQACLTASQALEWHGSCSPSVHTGNPNQQSLPDPTLTGPNPSEQTLLTEMLEGPRSFFWKREEIDEYGWRNFGDVWADHEGKYSDDATPVISHYNNQYDLLHGLLREYLRTHDERWWELANPLAQHIIDIDIYDTDLDRVAYNGGLFWHTSHYRDAGTSSHRTFSKRMVGEKHAVNGGGPGNEHNFTSGLVLYYQLTGSAAAKRTVLRLADWVMAMDDGNQDLLSPFSRKTTGKASSTRSPSYHGPGRGVGNSINALMDAWQLTRDESYLQSCCELVHRCVHPCDDIASLELGDSENRWSYPIALQALFRFLSIAGDNAPETCAHIRASLIRFGEWMLHHERLHLDTPNELEFPTETWAAQDLRTGTTLMLIGSLAEGDLSAQMHDTGSTLYDSALRQLMSFSSRCCTRPAAIALQQFPIRWFAESHSMIRQETNPNSRDEVSAFAERIPTVTQRENLRQQLRSPRGLVQLAANSLSLNPWLQSIGEFRARFLGQDRLFPYTPHDETRKENL